MHLTVRGMLLMARVGSNQAEADKGKVIEPPTFIIKYGPNTSSKEAMVMVGMHIKMTDQALQDHQLTEELMRMVMLPADWEMAHDITILHEALNSFAWLNFELENKGQTADARAEVARELLHATKEREKKYQKKLAQLETELRISRNKSTNLEEKFGWLKADFQKEMESTESALIEERGKGVELLKKLSSAEEKLLEAELTTETRV
ncbi:hypothetical protein COCNU_12G007860 [Cocos nucifera]|uniref:Uncharacterized protein n=1 Tax=Cocos nucifera TaxID=13894 RepID=A0A8K0ISI8_COCNU|nr:hypothetical protein COCNU_12G007860 [Cocos nucifera]